VLTGAASTYAGTYKATSVYQAHTYYYNSAGRMFLYYLPGQGWSVNPTLGGTTFFYNTQNVATPNLITTAWSVAGVQTVCAA
jgi:hypothetical protein